MRKKLGACLVVTLTLFGLTLVALLVILFWPMPKGEIYFNYTKIEVPDGEQVGGSEINSQGWVCGKTGNNFDEGFLWHQSTGFHRMVAFNGLPILSGIELTDSGTLYGTASVQDGPPYRPFIQSVTGSTILDPTATNLAGSPRFVNNSGQAILVGHLLSENESVKYYFWEPGIEPLEIDTSPAKRVELLEFLDNGDLILRDDGDTKGLIKYYRWNLKTGNKLIEVGDYAEARLPRIEMISLPLDDSSSKLQYLDPTGLTITRDLPYVYNDVASASLVICAGTCFHDKFSEWLPHIWFRFDALEKLDLWLATFYREDILLCTPEADLFLSEHTKGFDGSFLEPLTKRLQFRERRSIIAIGDRFL